MGHDVDLFFNIVCMESVYVIKLFGVEMDWKLNWKRRIHLQTNIKTIKIIAKGRRKLHKSSLIIMYFRLFIRILFILITFGEIHTSCM